MHLIKGAAANIKVHDAEALHALGIECAQRHDYVTAREKIEAAIQLNPHQATYHNSLGNVFRRLNALDEARNAYRKAIKINPGYAIAYNNIANCYSHKEQFHAAKKAYEKAIALKENYADAHSNVGILLARLGDDTAAISHLKKALMINPNLIAALNQLGDCYLRHDHFSEAIEIFLNCIALTPENSEAQHRLGIAYFHLKQFEKAKKQFEIVLIMDHKQSEVNQYLANTLIELRDPDKAMTYYFRQLEIKPEFETFYNVGVLLMMKERLKEALIYFEQALTIKPDDLSLFLNMGMIFLKQSEIEKAITIYQKANAFKQNDPEIQHILSALKKDQTPSRAPTEFISHLFNQYAPYYDHHLTAGLKYTVPEKIVSTVKLIEPTLDQWNIIDLGCGTGLCGVLFKPYSKKLVGVDLSENMLSIARNKNCYDELILADGVNALTSFFEIDLIIAADVFTYMGDLRAIFLRAHDCLSKEGLFIFTVEKTHDQDFVLQETIRYAHSKKYLETLSADTHFTIAQIDNIILREQKNKPVEGYLVVLKISA